MHYITIVLLLQAMVLLIRRRLRLDYESARKVYIEQDSKKIDTCIYLYVITANYNSIFSGTIHRLRGTQVRGCR
jgi:hypothetical protein